MTNNRKYILPEDLGQFFWDTMYHEHLFMRDGKLDKHELAGLLEEKLKPLWDAELLKVGEENYDLGYENGYASGEDYGWRDGYDAGTDNYEG